MRKTLLISACAALMALLVPASAAAKPGNFYGITPQTALTDADYERLGQSGAANVRVSFTWRAVQWERGKCTPTGGACNWGAFDDIVGRSAAAGVKVLPFFYGSAPFVSTDLRKAPLKKADLRAWRKFVQSAVKRYGRNGVFWRDAGGRYGQARPIKQWQIWNEPSSSAYWHKPNARKYAKLVRASAKSIRKADRKSKVLLGGLFGTPTIHMRKYLRQFYKVNRIKRFFDEIAVHPFAKNLRGIKIQLRWARQAARKGGDRKVGIRITELGWGSRKRGHPLNKGRKGQAKMLRKSFRMLTNKRGKWRIRGVNWFTLQDTKSKDVCKFCRSAGLFNLKGNPKPSWRAFKKFAR